MPWGLRAPPPLPLRYTRYCFAWFLSRDRAPRLPSLPTSVCSRYSEVSLQLPPGSVHTDKTQVGLEPGTITFGGLEDDKFNCERSADFLLEAFFGRLPTLLISCYTLQGSSDGSSYSWSPCAGSSKEENRGIGYSNGATCSIVFLSKMAMGHQQCYSGIVA